MKKVWTGLMVCCFVALSLLSVQAKEKVEVHFFYGKDCPHCEAERVFLEKIQLDYDKLTIYSYEIYDSEDNKILMKQMADDLGVNVTGVPFTIIGEQHFIGYLEGITDQGIRNAIDRIVYGTSLGNDYEIEIPLVGKFLASELSLPILTVVMGILDGFNPCAMWVLFFLLGMLIGMHDQKRMWVLGLTFIVTSAVMYFFFMAAWLNLTMFLKTLSWVRLLVAVVAFVAGFINLRAAFVLKYSGCKVVDPKRKKTILERIKRFTHEKRFWFAIGGIIVLAISVNLIELLCSAGLPVVYTQILTLNKISTVDYYLYLSLYIFFFMLDDLIVFFTAMLTLNLSGLSAKYEKFLHIVGGILMVVIGYLLIFNPSLLMFS